jgi:type IV secretory pathway VirB2 component (pilin)
MMDGIGGMMWAAGLVWLLLVIVLVLAAAALVKYLRSGGTK